MGTCLSLILVKLCATNHNFFLVGNIIRQDLTQRKDFRNTLFNGQHVETEVSLKLCQFEQVIQDNIGRGITTHFNNKANSFTRRLITDCCNSFNTFFLGQTNDMFMDLSLINHVRKLSDYNALTTRFCSLNFGTRTKYDRTLTSLIGTVNTGFPHDQTTRWKIRTRENFHQLTCCDLRIVHHQFDSINCLRQIVRWDIGRHTNGNPCCAINK